MKFGRIKTQWASIKLTSQSEAIVCMKFASSYSCVFFETIEKLKDAIKNKIICVKNWVISVPDNRCITKSVELPASHIGQAYKMLEFELPSYLPVPSEELVYGCSMIKQNDNLLNVLVHILKIKSLEEILADYRAIGVKPAKMMVDSIAVKSWFNQTRQNNGPEVNLLFEKNCLFILAGSDGSLQRHDEIVFNSSDIESKKEQIKEEIHHLANEIVGAKKDQIVFKIACRKDIQVDIRNWFDNSFNSVGFLELPELVSYDGDSNFRDGQFAYESVVAQGLVRSIEEPRLAFLNLLPRKLLKKTEQKKLFVSASVTAALSVSLIFCLWLNFAVMNWRMSRACQRIKKEIAPIKHIAVSVESKRQRVKAIQKQLSNRDQISRIFSQLYKYSPREISISQLDYSSKSGAANLNIKGQANILSNAFEYSGAMKESELLDNIQIINAQQIPRPGGSVVEFKADCLVRQD